jgi:hypothetical protein
MLLKAVVACDEETVSSIMECNDIVYSISSPETVLISKLKS